MSGTVAWSSSGTLHAVTARFLVSLAVLLGLCGCRGGPGSPAAPGPARTYIDLLDQLGAAEKQPVHAPADAFQVVAAAANGRARRSLSVRVPARVTWTVRIPRHATLRAAVAAEGRASAPVAVRFRVVISDGRVSEELMAPVVVAASTRADRGWVPLVVDLSGYAGWQWSLFYRPSSRPWRLSFTAEPLAPLTGEIRGLWDTPDIRGTK